MNPWSLKLRLQSSLSLSKVADFTGVEVDKGPCQLRIKTYKSYIGFPVVDTCDILTI